MSSKISNVCTYYNIYPDAYEPLQKIFRGKFTVNSSKHVCTSYLKKFTWLPFVKA